MENAYEYLFRLYALEAKAGDCAPVLLLSGIGDNFPTPCPGIMRQKDIEMAMSGEIQDGRHFAHAIVPFCVRNKIKWRQRVTVTSHIMPMEPKFYLGGHRVEITDKLPTKDLPEIDKIVKERGAVSFIINDHKGMEGALKSFPAKASKLYPYLQLMHYRTGVNGRGSAGDNMSLLTTFVDLPYCMPIYDGRRVNGMGVYMFLFYPKSSKASNQFRFHDAYMCVLSHHAENILTIDGGSKVNNPQNIPGALTDHMISAVRADKKDAAMEAKKKSAGPKAVPASPAVSADEMMKKRMRSRMEKEMLHPEERMIHNLMGEKKYERFERPGSSLKDKAEASGWVTSTGDSSSADQDTKYRTFTSAHWGKLTSTGTDNSE